MLASQNLLVRRLLLPQVGKAVAKMLSVVLAEAVDADVDVAGAVASEVLLVRALRVRPLRRSH